MAKTTDKPSGGFADLLGLKIIKAEAGESIVQVTVRDEHLRSLDIAHGGLVAGLLDTALGTAAYSKAAEGFCCVTLQLDVKYVKPALPGRTLTARCKCDHAGKRTAAASARVTDDEGRLVATGSASLLYLPQPT